MRNSKAKRIKAEVFLKVHAMPKVGYDKKMYSRKEIKEALKGDEFVAMYRAAKKNS